MTDEAFWVNAAFTVVGALIGAVATLAAARFTWRIQHYNEAAAIFRSAFVEQIYRLRRTDVDVFHVLDEAAIAHHERAKIVFEPFLSGRELDHLNAAWKNYVQKPGTVAPGSLQNRPEEVRMALSKLESLLSCAPRK